MEREDFSGLRIEPGKLVLKDITSERLSHERRRCVMSCACYEDGMNEHYTYHLVI